MNLVRKTEQLIREERLFDRGDRILAAVSGGPDSVALLRVLAELSAEWEWRIAAVHANHGLRGEESEADARFVRELADSLGVACVVADLPVRQELERRGGNLQDVARELRYRFFMEVATREGTGKIALAHHADDQAETVLLHLLRGSGTAGLGGMRIARREKNVELVRPFLRMNKTELVSYCAERGYAYRTDSSNEKTKYRRNEIRLNVLPVLTEMYPQVVPALNRLAEVSRAEEEWMAAVAKDEAKRTFRPHGGGYRASKERFAALPVALQRRLIKLILSYLSVPDESADFEKVEAIRKAATGQMPPNLRLDVGAGIRFVREYDALRFEPANDGHASRSFYYEVNEVPYVVRLESGILSFSWTPIAEAGSQIAVDAEALRWPLVARTREPGDRIRLQGVGTKKVKKVLIDEKVPPSMRDGLPVVCDAERNILWLPGIRQSDIAQINERTKKSLHIHFSAIIQ